MGYVRVWIDRRVSLVVSRCKPSQDVVAIKSETPEVESFQGFKIRLPRAFRCPLTILLEGLLSSPWSHKRLSGVSHCKNLPFVAFRSSPAPSRVSREMVATIRAARLSPFRIAGVPNPSKASSPMRSACVDLLAGRCPSGRSSAPGL